MLNHKTIKTILLALCLVSLAGAGEEGSRIELVPVYEKTFADTIQNVIYDEMEVTVEQAKNYGRNYVGLAAKQKVKMLYPKVVITRNEISFYAGTGELKKSISRKIKMKSKDAVTEVFVSSNGKYVGLRKSIYEEGIGSTSEFVMFDDSGKELWETDVSKLAAGAYYISPNGEYFVAYGDPTGDLCDYIPSIWDKNGMRVELFPEGIPDVDAYWIGDNVAFTPDGERIIVVKRDHRGKLATAILFTKYGKKIWERRIGEGGGGWRSIKVSPSGKYIVLTAWESSTKKTAIVLLDKNGNMLWKIPNIKPGTPDFMFAEDEERLIYLNAKGLLYYIDVEHGNLCWQFDKTAEEIGRFYTISSMPNGNLFVVGIYGHYGRPDRIFIFNKKGEILMKQEFESGAFGGIPLLKINTEGKEMIYCKNNSIYENLIVTQGR